MREKRVNEFYEMLIKFLNQGKTSWGKMELTAAIKDLYIEFLSKE